MSDEVRVSYHNVHSRLEDLKGEVSWVMRSARAHRLTSTTSHQLFLDRVQGSVAYQRLPRWAQERIWGYYEAWRDRFWSEEVIWAHRLIDGWVNPKTFNMADRYQDIISSAHIWKEPFEKDGTVYFFTEPTPV